MKKYSILLISILMCTGTIFIITAQDEGKEAATVTEEIAPAPTPFVTMPEEQVTPSEAATVEETVEITPEPEPAKPEEVEKIEEPAAPSEEVVTVEEEATEAIAGMSEEEIETLLTLLGKLTTQKPRIKVINALIERAKQKAKLQAEMAEEPPVTESETPAETAEVPTTPEEPVVPGEEVVTVEKVAAEIPEMIDEVPFKEPLAVTPEPATEPTEAEEITEPVSPEAAEVSTMPEEPIEEATTAEEELHFTSKHNFLIPY